MSTGSGQAHWAAWGTMGFGVASGIMGASRAGVISVLTVVCVVGIWSLRACHGLGIGPRNPPPPPPPQPRLCAATALTALAVAVGGLATMPTAFAATVLGMALAWAAAAIFAAYLPSQAR